MDYQRKVLSNGLRLILVPMENVQSATVLVLVGAGSRYETHKTNGISHFLEHMAFKGTKRRPTAMAISSAIDGIGGEFNAFTSKESTGYYIKSSSNHIDLSVDMLADMLTNSLFAAGEIEKERGVILEEINLYEDTPSRKINDLYEQLLYGDTPMGWDVGGRKEVIAAIKREDFIAYLKRLYSPHNMAVVVAGGFDQKKVIRLVEKQFGTLMWFEIAKAASVLEKQVKPALLVKHKKTEQMHIALGVRTFSVHDKRRYILSVLGTILGGGMSSRLFHEVREKRGLAYYVRTTAEFYDDCGTLVTTAGVDRNRVTEAIKVILEEHNKLKVKSSKFKVSNEELTRTKEYMKGHLVLEFEDSRAVAGFYASQEILERAIDTPTKTIEKIEKVRLDELESLSEEIFLSESLNLALIGGPNGGFDSRQEFENLLEL